MTGVQTCALPIWDEKEKREEAIRSFHRVTDRLDERIFRRFGRTVDCDVVLFLGLCNGAGWVTPINRRTTVLLGIEKIMELDWCDEDAMTGLIVHELGHAYHAQYGKTQPEGGEGPDAFLWQLFSEGIAMVFEQEIKGDPTYFHQDRDGWLAWCDANANLIRRAFVADLPTMTHDTQRYFGDWVRFEGWGDTGYYLGARFIRFLLESADFDTIITYGMDEIRDGFERFLSFNL